MTIGTLSTVQIRERKGVQEAMAILSWLIVGLIAGWLASVVMGTNAQQGVLMDIALGIVGALVGGFLMSLFGGPGVTGINLVSILVATIGAILLIGIGRAITSAEAT